jgi:hypothetical protein
MPRIVIDPDGTQSDAAYVLVLHPTGVRYAIQCAGYLTEEREAEGFLIPLGGIDVARPLMEWFWKAFRCNSYIPAAEWGIAKIAQLRELVAQVVCWYSEEDGSDEDRLFLALDEERLMECTEAWVPVKTPYGAGFLLFPNCD